MAAAQQPLGLIGQLAEEIRHPVGNDIFLSVDLNNRAIDPDLQRFMAQRAGSTTVQLDDASHVGGLSHYKTRFVKLIEQAVDATAT